MYVRHLVFYIYILRRDIEPVRVYQLTKNKNKQKKSLPTTVNNIVLTFRRRKKKRRLKEIYFARRIRFSVFGGGSPCFVSECVFRYHGETKTVNASGGSGGGGTDW